MRRGAAMTGNREWRRDGLLPSKPTYTKEGDVLMQRRRSPLFEAAGGGRVLKPLLSSGRVPLLTREGPAPSGEGSVFPSPGGALSRGALMRRRRVREPSSKREGYG